MSPWNSVFLFFVAVQILSSTALASVPASSTFRYVNSGELGPYVVEYQADYRTLSIFTFPFQFCFYNTTPNAYTLALRMGTVRSESLMRWVWEANRANPVGENATFSFGKDGNLVLADANGRVAWQSGTANKGVVGFKLLPNGNIVLHDSKGKFIWQSFDYPTDTLLVGQTLRAGGTTKLVSRASRTKNQNGAYSLVLEPQSFTLYNQTKGSPRPTAYSVLIGKKQVGTSSLESVRFDSEPKTRVLELVYNFVGSASNGGRIVLGKPKFNSTLTYLRLGIDGNLKAFTYNTETENGSWRETYSLLAK